MFAVPEHTVFVARRPAVSATAVVRAAVARAAAHMPPTRGPAADDADFAAAVSAEAAVPVSTDDPRVTAEVVALPPGAVVDASHDAGQGAFTVLRGAVDEETGGRTRRLTPGQVRLFGPGYRHRVRNSSDEAAFALRVRIA